MANEPDLEKLEQLRGLTRPEKWLYIIAYFEARRWRRILPWIASIIAAAVVAGFMFVGILMLLSRRRRWWSDESFIDTLRVDPYWLIPIGVCCLYAGYRVARAEHPIVRVMLVRWALGERSPRCVKCGYLITDVAPIEGRPGVARCPECGLVNPLPGPGATA